MNDPYPKKSLGQHWLTDAASLQAIVDAAGIDASQTVLEIGPGLGALTALLVARAREVVAVELDDRLAAELPARIAAANLRIIHADILQLDLMQLPAGYTVVANIPYYLTSKLIRTLSEASNPPACAILLVQKEVAERVAAAPGGMSILSVTAQWYWDVSVGREVPARLFSPPPKVDSQILILQYRTKPLFTNVDTKHFFRIVKAGFSQRRKTLLNSLSAGLHLERSLVEKALITSDISPQARAQNLSLAQWHTLCQALTQ